MGEWYEKQTTPGLGSVACRRIEAPRGAVLAVCGVFLFALALCLLTQGFAGEAAYAAADVLLALFITLFVTAGTNRLKATRTDRLLILSGYAIRLLLALLDACDASVLTWLTGGYDDFYPVSLAYFRGDYSGYYTNYPYVLNAIYQVTGPDRIAPMLINILLWFLGFFVMQKAVGDFWGRKRRSLVLFYIFLPYPLTLSCCLMRESLISLLLMLSFLLLLIWMRRGRIEFFLLSLAAAAPAVYLHRGNSSMWIADLLVFLIWDPGQQRWRLLNRKLLLLPPAAALGLPMFNRYFGRASSLRSMLELISTSLWVDPQGRAYYLPGWSMTYRNPLQFLGNSLYMMINFWISPSPWFWSAPLDPVGTLLDTIPWLLFFGGYFKCMRRRDGDRRAFAGVIVALVFTLVYGWGTLNAGTAMRHRGQLLGVLVMAAMLAAGQPDGKTRRHSPI